jgi:hypothetical protein
MSFFSLPQSRVEQELPSLSRLSMSGPIRRRHRILILPYSTVSFDYSVPRPVTVAHRIQRIQLARLPVRQRRGKRESGLGCGTAGGSDAGRGCANRGHRE